METEIYLNNGTTKENKILCLGSALKYSRKDTPESLEKMEFINDTFIEETLKSTYFNYGIIPRELFVNLNSDENEPFYLMTIVDAGLYQKVKAINLPSKIVEKINMFIDTCHTYLDILFKNYESLSLLEINMVNKLDVYRNKFLNKNSYTYIEKVLFFNRIRNFINEIKHEKIMDFQYLYSNLLKFKYYTLLEEKNVLIIDEQMLIFDTLYNQCHESIEFLDENNEKKYYDIKSGSIKIDEIKLLLQKYIDSF